MILVENGKLLNYKDCLSDMEQAVMLLGTALRGEVSLEIKYSSRPNHSLAIKFVRVSNNRIVGRFKNRDATSFMKRRRQLISETEIVEMIFSATALIQIIKDQVPSLVNLNWACDYQIKFTYLQSL